MITKAIVVAGLVGALRVVFATFAKDMGTDVQSAVLLFCLAD
jgi:hypothetical protein